MNEVVVVVVTHNPELDSLLKIIRQAISAGARVIWIDNASFNLQNQSVRSILGSRQGVAFIRLRKNLGLALPLRLATMLARRRGARYLLYFDQDSIPCPSYLNLYDRARKNAERSSKPSSYMILSNYRDFSPSSNLNDQLRDICKTSDHGDRLVETEHGILSGLFVHLDVLEKIGGISKKYILDFLDYDLIARAKTAGVRVYRFDSPMMLQPIGQRKVYHILSRDIYIISHSPVRWELMGIAVTNFLRDHLAQSPRYTLGVIFRILRRLLKVLLLLRDFRSVFMFLYGIGVGLLPEKKQMHAMLKALNP